MFVWGFLIGFLLAFIVNWFWMRQLKSAASFGGVIGKETNGEKYRDTVIGLEIEVENLQDQIQRLEDTFTFDKKVVFPTPPPTLKSTVTPIRENLKEEFLESDSNKKIKKQGEVLGLWEKGKQISEIAMDTGLGKGEVELILSLRNKLHRDGLGENNRVGEEKNRLSV